MQVRLHGSRGGVFGGHRPPGTPVAPCIIIITIRKGEERRKKKREVLHLFRCYTHTHPAGAGSTLKGKRKRKADTNDGPTTKTAQGGREQTDLRNQPTRRNGPDKEQGTHLNPTTHYGEAAKGGKLGTKWGTSLV